MEHRQLLFQSTTILQIELTGGAGGNDAIRPHRLSAFNDRIDHGSGDIRPAGRQERATAAVGVSPGQGLGPQGAQDSFHFALNELPLPVMWWPKGGAPVIRHKLQAIEVPFGGIFQTLDIPHQDFQGPTSIPVHHRHRGLRLRHDHPFLQGHVAQGIHHRRHVNVHGALVGAGMAAHAHPDRPTAQGLLAQTVLQ
jgi:hypothetical protein